jgi:hypothetical protein
MRLGLECGDHDRGRSLAVSSGVASRLVFAPDAEHAALLRFKPVN